MRDDEGCSRGFGFVSYVEVDIADKVITGLYGQHVHSKPLHVFIAERKEERRAKLASRYMQRLAQMRMSVSSGLLDTFHRLRLQSSAPGQMYAPAVGGGFVAQGMAPRGATIPQMAMTPQQMRVAPQQMRMAPQPIGMAPPQIEMAPQQTGMTPQPMGMIPQQMSRAIQSSWSRMPMHKMQCGASPCVK